MYMGLYVPLKFDWDWEGKWQGIMRGRFFWGEKELTTVKIGLLQISEEVRQATDTVSYELFHYYCSPL